MLYKFILITIFAWLLFTTEINIEYRDTHLWSDTSPVVGNWNEMNNMNVGSWIFFKFSNTLVVLSCYSCRFMSRCMIAKISDQVCNKLTEIGFP